ncbi:MAG: MSMEG_0568 family radical SAM protein [Deltaproteobacteria bacterium]|nr:MAG: MSMEG_0568 family radical SAM protein [Deltaproteobacteria bacterium]
MDDILLKVELQGLGAKVKDLPPGVRQGGAGPAEGTVISFGGRQASVPLHSPFVARSPYYLKKQTDRYWLSRGRKKIREIRFPETPVFYGKRTWDGVPYSQIALLHGEDCLGSTVVQSCIYQEAGKGCGFCGINESLKNKKTIVRKTPSHLAEVAAAAESEGVRHAVLTSGCWGDDSSVIHYLAECTRAIKQRTSLKVQAQFNPPANPELLNVLKDAGVDTVGIHIESFDSPVLKQVSPHKARVGRKGYRRCWQEAVGIFGRNQVISFLIAGLGESKQSLIKGCEELAKLGVYPHVVPLRPIPGTKMANRRPPAPARMRGIYEKAAFAVRNAGLSWRTITAGCGRCPACSALGEFEDYLAEKEVACQIARTDDELDTCYRIRHQVFVEEQGIFKGSDRDEMDAEAIHIIAKAGDVVQGTVRLNRKYDGQWWGSRLAVIPKYRGIAGRSLVRKAEETVREKKGKVLRAYIQENRVDFFKQLGWKDIGGPTQYCGLPHQLMEADLY